MSSKDKKSRTEKEIQESIKQHLESQHSVEDEPISFGEYERNREDDRNYVDYRLQGLQEMIQQQQNIITQLNFSLMIIGQLLKTKKVLTSKGIASAAKKVREMQQEEYDKAMEQRNVMLSIALMDPRQPYAEA